MMHCLALWWRWFCHYVVSDSFNPVDCSPPGFSSSMGFPRQEYWSGLHFLPQGLFQTQGSNPGLLHCRQITEPPGKPFMTRVQLIRSETLECSTEIRKSILYPVPPEALTRKYVAVNIFFFLEDFFDVDHFLKAFIEFVVVLILFNVTLWFFGCEACGILARPPGIKPALPALEGEVLTTGSPGKFPSQLFKTLPLQKSRPALFFPFVSLSTKLETGMGKRMSILESYTTDLDDLDPLCCQASASSSPWRRRLQRVVVV